MEYRGKENLGRAYDPMMEHLRFSSSFHNRPSYGMPPSNRNRASVGSSTSKESGVSENRRSTRKHSNGSHGSSYRGEIQQSHSWDSKDSRGSHRSGNTTDSQSRRIAGGSNYNHNKRISRTQIAQEERSHRTSYGSRSRHAEARQEQDTVDEEDENFLHTSDNVIALFGAYGTTGQYFLQVALEAGYRVRVLVLPGVELEIPESKNLTIVTGTFDEEKKIERVLKRASYIVCMLNDCTKIIEEKDEESTTSNYRFVQRLVSILERVRSKRVLLYQASAVALDNKGSTPMLSSIVKKMQITKAKREALAEQDKIVEYLSTQMDQDSCRYIITRPSDLIWDKPSKRKLAASKSQPGPYSITNIDLAEFSLNALKMEKLYNTCPYVVQDY